ncbi:hypothetical protein OIU77_017782 [Salix suchowensis]|uniref:Uncharacterized protein n=1 Tax=Salix suchowensis TaxID=1278906 RepID=A0ABQ8ZPZ1_9ROSI|nr:hypothetical protein OIU77_017782 [Salix suchowensis]
MLEAEDLTRRRKGTLKRRRKKKKNYGYFQFQAQEDMHVYATSLPLFYYC